MAPEIPQTIIEVRGLNIVGITKFKKPKPPAMMWVDDIEGELLRLSGNYGRAG